MEICAQDQRDTPPDLESGLDFCMQSVKLNA